MYYYFSHKLMELIDKHIPKCWINGLLLQNAAGLDFELSIL